MNTEPLNPYKMHVLLYSFSQGCFHFETLDKTMESGVLAYIKNRCFQDYIVLGVSRSREDVEKLRDTLVSECGRYTPTRSPHDPKPTNSVIRPPSDASV